jgi:hypothetical protein
MVTWIFLIRKHNQFYAILTFNQIWPATVKYPFEVEGIQKKIFSFNDKNKS